MDPIDPEEQDSWFSATLGYQKTPRSLKETYTSPTEDDEGERNSSDSEKQYT